jgi:hypothetical protein
MMINRIDTAKKLIKKNPKYLNGLGSFFNSTSVGKPSILFKWSIPSLIGFLSGKPSSPYTFL